MLRHTPQDFALALDSEGYAALNEVLAAVRTRIPQATLEDIETVVNTHEQDKRRFTISEGEIRANYGHSLNERIRHERATPPAVLLHGTSAQAVNLILREGLQPMKRQYVHLTTDRALASRVGARHGPAQVLTIDAFSAHAAGIAFYRANEAFWFADRIPKQYLLRRT